jgi:hypothetical protein
VVRRVIRMVELITPLSTHLRSVVAVPAGMARIVEEAWILNNIDFLGNADDNENYRWVAGD